MRTFRIKNEADTIYAFEIENAYIPVADVVSTLARVDGVSEVFESETLRLRRIPPFLLLQGQGRVVWEPFGVTSRYWIGPREAERDMDFADVETAFRQYRPALLSNPSPRAGQVSLKKR